jgi:anaerobic magnesium-protoporphyrin IX monomethyl ester cyclase
MKILFINPPNLPFSESSLLIEPIDTLTVASHVQSLGHKVSLIDMDVAKREGKSIRKEIEEIMPDYIVITFDYHIPLFTSDAIKNVNEIITVAKSFGKTTILGGRLPTYHPNLFLADIIIKGEMEPALKEIFEGEKLHSIKGLILNLEKLNSAKAKKIKQNKTELTKLNLTHHYHTEKREEYFDLNQLPNCDRRLVDLNNYIGVRSVLTSRSCVKRCKFCPVPNFWGRYRTKNPEKVVEEIKHLVDECSAKKIIFLDDNATVDKKRIKNICKLLIDKNVKTTLGCLSTVSSYDENIIELMQNAGFRWVHYGCEVASDRVLKNLNKNITVKEIKKAIVGTKKKGLRVRTSWIFDSPTITLKEIDDTIDLILETKPEEIRIHYLALRAGSEFANKRIQQNENKNESNNGDYKIEGNSNIKKQSQKQYIHFNKPHSSFDVPKKELIEKKVFHLISELKKEGYVFVENPSEWKKFKGNKNSKIVSLCPMLYGVGWEQ